MKKAQRKDFFREIRKSLNRWLSILAIVALGVAFFSGIRSSEPDMRLSVDKMADEANFMDIRVLSTLGLSEDDLAAIRDVEGAGLNAGISVVQPESSLGESEPAMSVIPSQEASSGEEASLEETSEEDGSSDEEAGESDGSSDEEGSSEPDGSSDEEGDENA